MLPCARVERKTVQCPKTIRTELDVKRIDLYQFHWPDDSGTPVEDCGPR